MESSSAHSWVLYLSLDEDSHSYLHPSLTSTSQPEPELAPMTSQVSDFTYRLFLHILWLQFLKLHLLTVAIEHLHSTTSSNSYALRSSLKARIITTN